jgi:hypothetical protein
LDPKICVATNDDDEYTSPHPSPFPFEMFFAPQLLIHTSEVFVTRETSGTFIKIITDPDDMFSKSQPDITNDTS